MFTGQLVESKGLEFVSVLEFFFLGKRTNMSPENQWLVGFCGFLPP